MTVLVDVFSDDRSPGTLLRHCLTLKVERPFSYKIAYGVLLVRKESCFSKV